MTKIAVNPKNRTIELSKAYSELAYCPGTDEYNQLQETRRDYPNYRVVTVKQKGAAVKADFANLSFDFMDKYIASHDEKGDLMPVYRTLRGRDENGVAVDYQTIKDWFLNTFPEFEQFRADRLALVEKIKREKEARLAARKKAV